MKVQHPIKPEESYLINQSPEVSVGENTRWMRRFKSFPALQNRNYRLYFGGQLVSVIGTWLQIVAQGWLVLQLTNSPFLIGLVAALATAPSLLFSLFGGVIVDRFRKKKILYFTQIANLILASVLGVLTILNHVNVPLIATIAFLMGTVNALDAPARQAFVSDLVSREHLASAIALNSGTFNAGRVIGPGLAGLLIAWIGTGGAFIVNGVSYLAVVIALWYMDIQEKTAVQNLKPLQAIREGLRYSFSHPIIRILYIFTAVVSIFGWSYSTIMPVIAQDIFHVEAKGLGYLYAASGIGSLVAIYLISAFSERFRPIVFITGGNTIFALSLVLFSLSHSMIVALPLLFLVGLGLLCQSAMMNTTIQSMVKPEFRGRVMSIYVLMFLGMAPVGNFEIGFLTEHLGITTAIIINAIFVLIFGWIVFFYRNKIRAAYNTYKQTNVPAQE